MADSYEKLRKLTTDQLIKQYDHKAASTVIGLGFLREEIARRYAEEQTAQMMKMNSQMRFMTIVITVLTLINVIVVIIALFL